MKKPLNCRSEKKEKEDLPDYSSKETDPLLPSGRNSSSTSLVRRFSNKSPTQHSSQSPTLISPFGMKRDIHNNSNRSSMIANTRLLDHDTNDNNTSADHDGYESIEDISLPSQQLSSANNSVDPYCTTNPTESFITAKSSTVGVPVLLEAVGNEGVGNNPSANGSVNTSESKRVRMPPDTRSVGSADSEQPPLLEIPEEVYAVRKAALQVLKPLNKTWVSKHDERNDKNTTNNALLRYRCILFIAYLNASFSFTLF
jgi:hypothetical protein